METRGLIVIPCLLHTRPATQVRWSWIEVERGRQNKVIHFIKHDEELRGIREGRQAHVVLFFLLFFLVQTKKKKVVVFDTRIDTHSFVCLDRYTTQREYLGLIVVEIRAVLDDALTDGVEVLNLAIAEVCKQLTKTSDVLVLLLPFVVTVCSKLE